MSRHCGLIGLLALLLVAAHPAVAQAEFGITPGSEELSVLDAEGQPEVRAGAHPDELLVKFGLNAVEGKVEGNLKNLAFDLQPGLTGNPTGVPTCSRTVFDGGLAEEECPSDTQVGEAKLTIPELGELELSIHNVAPAPGEMAVLGAVNETLRLPIFMELRPGDHGTTLTLADVFQTLPVIGAEFDLWGVPADHQREPVAPRRPFLTLPSRCDEPLALTLRVNSWQAPEVEQVADLQTESNLSGCQSQSFEPTVAFALTSPAADTPSGGRIEIAAPDDESPDELANAQLRDAVIALPAGVTLSPAGVAGIEPCSDAAFGLGSTAPAACTAGSRVGSVEMVSSLLGAPISGDVYMGREHPGERFRLLVDASGPGVEIKFAGELKIDPATGRLTVSMVDLPQIPLERMTLSFADGQRAPLVTPLDCGPVTATARFDSQGGATRDVSSPSEDRGAAACHGATAFDPGFVAGGSELGAGKPTTLAITMSREDGEQALDRLVARLPRGVSPALAAVEQCEAAGAAGGACPEGSRIGSAVAEVGSGSEPAILHGDVFLTGPYRRAPFGLALTFRAQLGSFDMGTLVVRGGLTMNPRSGRATLETDSLPQIVDGVPIRFRTVGLDMDRPGFIQNPTSCKAESFDATIVSASESGSEAASPFQVRGCGSLGFRPTISMALRGAKQLRRRGKPGLRLDLRAPGGSTNLRNARIPLPRRLGFDPTGLQEICARTEAFAGDCPAGSRVGTAVASTVLARGRMGGSIYVVQPDGSGLPDLWTDLSEGRLHLFVQGRTEIRKGRLITKLVGMPDVPVAALAMRFRGGSSGIFTLRQNLCRRHSRKSMTSRVAFEGQDGAFRIATARLGHPRCRRTRARGAHHR